MAITTSTLIEGITGTVEDMLPEAREWLAFEQGRGYKGTLGEFMAEKKLSPLAVAFDQSVNGVISHVEVPAGLPGAEGLAPGARVECAIIPGGVGFKSQLVAIKPSLQERTP